MMNFSIRRKPPTLRTLIAREMHCSRRKVFVGDRYLNPISDPKMREFLAVDATNEIPWIIDIQDCNTFALYLRANAKRWFMKRHGWNAAVGTIWVKSYKELPAHAFNFHMNPALKFRYTEPQTDREIFRDKRKIMLVII